MLSPTREELSDAALEAVTEGSALRTLEVGAALLEPGDDANEVAVVMRGAMREVFITHEGLERTCGFAFEGDPVGAYADALLALRSRRRVEAIEQSALLVFSLRSVRTAAERFDEVARLLRALAERLYVRKAQREFELLTMDAQGRYEALRAQFPAIEQRVQQQQIASYLGITPVHLSRLRSRRRAARDRQSP